jgi:hypothetical protein
VTSLACSATSSSFSVSSAVTRARNAASSCSGDSPRRRGAPPVRPGLRRPPAMASAPAVPTVAVWAPTHSARYHDPESFDIHRTDGSHLALGHGIHFCLGAPLARIEARIALRVLHTRFPAMRLGVDPSELHWGHGDGLVLRRLCELPVLLGPSAAPARHPRHPDERARSPQDQMPHMSPAARQRRRRRPPAAPATPRA